MATVHQKRYDILSADGVRHGEGEAEAETAAAATQAWRKRQ